MALTDHVIVLSHLRPQVMEGPPVQSYEDTLRMLGVPEEAIAALPEAHRRTPVGMAGAAKLSNSALDVHPTGLLDQHGQALQRVTEVQWVCGCGQGLHSHHEAILGAWTRHVAKLEGIDADHLEKHAVAEIDGKWRPDGKPRVVCACSERFESPEFLPGPALEAWERHVRGGQTSAVPTQARRA